MRLRLDHLLVTVSAVGGRIVIAMPSLAEFLVKAHTASSEWLAGLERKKGILIAPFDRRAAVDCSLLDRAALGSGDKKGGRKDSWQAVKIDRQIVAIARVNQATHLVTDDEGLRSTALSVGLVVWRVAELDVPPSSLQQQLPYTAAAEVVVAQPAPPRRRLVTQRPARADSDKG